MESPDTVEIPIQKWKYHFRLLSWEEEFSIKFPKGKNPQKILLAHALQDISGILISNVASALRALDPIPSALLARMYVIYRGSSRLSRKFTAAALYTAPEPSLYVRRVQEQAAAQENQMDMLDRHLESLYGAKEVAEAKAVEQEVARGSLDETGKPRGAIKKDLNEE